MNGDEVDCPSGFKGGFIVGTSLPLLYVISLVLSACGCPFHPSVLSSVPSSIHPSSSSRKKKMMEEEEDDEWRQEQFIEMFM
jgi:hypothetical protein